MSALRASHQQVSQTSLYFRTLSLYQNSLYQNPVARPVVVAIKPHNPSHSDSCNHIGKTVHEGFVFISRGARLIFKRVAYPASADNKPS